MFSPQTQCIRLTLNKLSAEAQHYHQIPMILNTKNMWWHILMM